MILAVMIAIFAILRTTLTRDDRTPLSYDMTPGFKPFTKKNFVVRNKYMCVCVSLSITITANYFFLTVSNHSGYESRIPCGLTGDLSLFGAQRVTQTKHRLPGCGEEATLLIKKSSPGFLSAVLLSLLHM